jgi:AP-1-like factor
MDRNVALQNIAKRLKEENEKLRRENAALKERVTGLEQQAALSSGNDRKRWRDTSPAVKLSSSTEPSKKKSRVSVERPSSDGHSSLFSPPYVPSPPSIVSSPDSNGTSDQAFSPAYFDPQTHDSPIYSPQTNSMMPAFSFPHDGKPDTFDPSTFPTFDCGLCTNDTTCVCRQLAMQQGVTDRMVNGQAYPLKAETHEQKYPTAPLGNPAHLTSPSTSVQLSVLDNLPAYQPPVPLRRRPRVSPNLLFPISAQPPRSSSPAMCSGDPTNCSACNDDDFGRAFCAAVSEAISEPSSCQGCPCANNGSGRSCGNPGQCGPSFVEPAFPGIEAQSKAETMPTSDAWRQLKSHPNVSFADLTLLAEVVARRSQCTGPHLVMNHSAGHVNPEQTALHSSLLTPALAPGQASAHSVVLADPHAQYHERSARPSPAQPSPPSHLSNMRLGWGRPGVRQVCTEGVADALRILDNKFSH